MGPKMAAGGSMGSIRCGGNVGGGVGGVAETDDWGIKSIGDMLNMGLIKRNTMPQCGGKAKQTKDKAVSYRESPQCERAKG
jgi:hypothetical protein